MSNKKKRRKKRRSRRGFGFLVAFLAIIIILALAVGGGLYYVTGEMNKTEVQLDDVSARLAAAPMDYSERVSFSSDGIMTVKLDENDVWWFLNHAYNGNIQREIANKLSGYNMELMGLGLDINGSKSTFSIQAYWGIIPVNIIAHVDIGFNNGIVYAFINEAETFGRGYVLSDVDNTLGTSLAGFSLSFEPATRFMTEITGFEIGKDSITVSGPVNLDYLASLDVSEPQFTYFRLMYPEIKLVAPLAASYERNPAQVEKILLSEFAADSANFKTYFEQLCLLMPRSEVEHLTDNHVNFGFFSRWYGSFDANAAAAAGEAFGSAYDNSQRFIQSALNRLSDSLMAKQLKIAEGEFTYLDEKFDFESFYGAEYTYYSKYLPMTEARLCLMGGIDENNGHIISTFIDKPESLAEELDLMGVFGVGIITRGSDGSCYLLYRNSDGETNNYNIKIINEPVFNEMMNAQGVPVWNLG